MVDYSVLYHMIDYSLQVIAKPRLAWRPRACAGLDGGTESVVETYRKILGFLPSVL